MKRTPGSNSITEKLHLCGWDLSQKVKIIAEIEKVKPGEMVQRLLKDAVIKWRMEHPGVKLQWAGMAPN